MPILAMHERNDARGAASLLAREARDCIRDPAIAPTRNVALNNVYRLLETYRSNASFGLEPPTGEDSSEADMALTLTPPPERHVKEVRRALEESLTAVLEGQTKEQTIEAIESVLRRIAYPQKHGPLSENEKTRAVTFFERMLENLT